MSAEIETLHVPFRRDFLIPRGIVHTYHRPDQPTGGTIGDADFILYAMNHCLHIEFKDKLTAISAGQVKRHAELARVGIRVHICRALQPAIELTLAWLATLGEIAAIEPVGKGMTAAIEPGLVRFGASVFRRTEGRLEHVRVATPADSALPSV